jgi:hypothetical protein
MRNLLVWCAVAWLVLAVGLAPDKCPAQNQVKKLLKQGAGQMEKMIQEGEK